MFVILLVVFVVIFMGSLVVITKFDKIELYVDELSYMGSLFSSKVKVQTSLFTIQNIKDKYIFSVI